MLRTSVVSAGVRGIHSTPSRNAIGASELSSILEERVTKYYQKFDVQEVSYVNATSKGGTMKESYGDTNTQRNDNNDHLPINKAILNNS